LFTQNLFTCIDHTDYDILHNLQYGLHKIVQLSTELRNITLHSSGTVSLPMASRPYHISLGDEAEDCAPQRSRWAWQTTAR